MRRLLAALVLLTAGPASAREWYVRAGAAGTGTAAAPLGALHLALEQAAAGDRIHVAEGQYTGRDGRGELTVTADGVSVLGGYSPDFATRDPLVHKSLLQRTPNSPQGAEARPVLWVRGAADVTLDGLTVDGAARATYDDQGNLVRDLSPLAPLVELEQVRGATLRALTVVNGAWMGVRASLAGGVLTVEHCTFVNHVGHALDVIGVGPAEVRVLDDLFAFTWRWRDLGGNAVRVGGVRSLRFEENLVAYGEAASVLARPDAENLVMRRNVFMDPLALVQSGITVGPEQLDDSALVQAEGNVTTARMFLDPEFMIRWTNRRPAGERVSSEPFAPLRRKLGSAEVPAAGRAWAFAYPLPALPRILWKGTQPAPRPFVPVTGGSE